MAHDPSMCNIAVDVTPDIAVRLNKVIPYGMKLRLICFLIEDLVEFLETNSEGPALLAYAYMRQVRLGDTLFPRFVEKGEALEASFSQAQPAGDSSQPAARHHYGKPCPPKAVFQPTPSQAGQAEETPT